MTRIILTVPVLCYGCFCCFLNARGATTLDTIGATLLRQLDPALTGNGVSLAQPEAAAGAAFEVNPGAVGLASSVFSYISSSGTASVFPNSVGLESSHADAVGGNLYGLTTGVAPQIAHVDNYDATYFFDNI